jgi:rRNA processing protein Gar1
LSVPDPVSWKVVERGWKVLDESGKEVGHVDEITGDADADIFDGVEVSHGVLEKTEYVPSERVVDIRVGEVIVRHE